ncbi:uncharacterized protein HD556DRAFT_1286426 [Suillus plorans]|uniref:37S ribosomal protein mrp10, mitochondrial n=1 Tax=Suillus plorans TaxID=116603 RepID=A0A9P7J336_9AGAM|nr:uncharacterized protein HD556DRAFT_1286426 [Suillus plorans]KAG1800828.1 hypothetical protein HD556DRAFT_1286426 [Suillus plorans]
MTVHIAKVKVRPRKNLPPNVCAVELSNMLGCWAATGDMLSSNHCQAAAETLFQCMRTAPVRGKQPRSSINYHLARLGRNSK